MTTVLTKEAFRKIPTLFANSPQGEICQRKLLKLRRSYKAAFDIINRAQLTDKNSGRLRWRRAQ